LLFSVEMTGKVILKKRGERLGKRTAEPTGQ
jgi:hypothetical protein